MGEMKLGAAMQAYLEKSRIRKEMQQLRLQDQWEVMMGKTIARYTERLQLVDKTLFIHTSIAPLKQELMYQKATIIQRVNEHLGENTITEVVVR